MGENNDFDSLSKLKMRYNFLVVIGAFILLGVVFIWSFTIKADNIATVLGTLTSVVGTIIGAYLGVAIGSAGKQDVIKQLSSTKKELTQTRNDKELVNEDLCSTKEKLNNTMTAKEDVAKKLNSTKNELYNVSNELKSANEQISENDKFIESIKNIETSMDDKTLNDPIKRLKTLIEQRDIKQTNKKF